jgi:hypothetical protein
MRIASPDKCAAPTGGRGGAEPGGDDPTTLNVRPNSVDASRPGLATSSPDPSWTDLYRAGGIAAALYVLLIFIPLVLLNTTPQPPLSGGAALLQFIASHKAVYIIELVSFVGLSLPALVVFLALYVALKHLNKSLAALGALVGGASEVVALAYSSSPPSLNGSLVYLSDHYVAAATIEQRAAFATAAEGLVAQSNAVNAAGILTAIGILIISLVMLKGVFRTGIAYLGMVTGAVGIVSEVLRNLMGPGYYVYGLLLPIWFIAVGWGLLRLAGASSSAQSSPSD